MGRPENPLDPSSGSLAQFAWDLRKLRESAGKPTYRKLAQRAGYSDTALSSAASGRTLPSLEVTLAFVGACGGDMKVWEQRWHSLAPELGASQPSPSALAVPDDPTAGDPEPAPPARQPRYRWRVTRKRAWAAALVASTLAIATPLAILMALPAMPRHARSVAAGSPTPRASISVRASSPAPRKPSTTRRPQRRVVPQPSPAPVLVVVAPSPTPSSQSTSAHRVMAPTTFSAISGPGCGSTATYGSYPAQGWIWQSSGGYCGGFESHWIIGSDTSADTTYSTYTWWFQTGLTNATCSVSVFAPTGDDTVVGGHPGHYHVYTGSNQAVGSFDIDERDNMGSWVSAGSFRADGEFWVVLDNAASGSHQVAASAVSVNCAA